MNPARGNRRVRQKEKRPVGIDKRFDGAFYAEKDRGKAMSCPKCKAKIGGIKQQVTTETGNVIGVLCYICGFWQQEFPKS
jgi:hypothetical protein